VFLFEHGKGYHPEVRDHDGLPREVRELAFVLARRDGEHPYPELREKVALLLRRAGCPATIVRPWQGADQPWVHPGAAAAIDRDGSPVGYVAHLHPATARRLGVPGTTAIACVDVRALLLAGRTTVRFEPLPSFPQLP